MRHLKLTIVSVNGAEVLTRAKGVHIAWEFCCRDNPAGGVTFNVHHADTDHVEIITVPPGFMYMMELSDSELP